MSDESFADDHQSGPEVTQSNHEMNDSIPMTTSIGRNSSQVPTLTTLSTKSSVLLPAMIISPKTTSLSFSGQDPMDVSFSSTAFQGVSSVVEQGQESILPERRHTNIPIEIFETSTTNSLQDIPLKLSCLKPRPSSRTVPSSLYTSSTLNATPIGTENMKVDIRTNSTLLEIAPADSSTATTASTIAPTPNTPQSKHKMPKNIARIMTALREEKSPFLKEIEHEKLTNYDVKTESTCLEQRESCSNHLFNMTSRFDESESDSGSAMTSSGLDTELVSIISRPSPSPRLKDPLAYVTQSSKLNPENHFPSVRLRDEGLSPTFGPSLRSKRKLSATDLIVDKLDLASNRVIKRPNLRHHSSLSPRQGILSPGIHSAFPYASPSHASSHRPPVGGVVPSSVHGLFSSIIHGQIHPHRPRSHSNSSLSSMSSIHLPPPNMTSNATPAGVGPTILSTSQQAHMANPSAGTVSFFNATPEIPISRDQPMSITGPSPRSPHLRPQMLNLTGAGEDFSKMSLSDS